MYRKRMSEALREARAYTAINEVMVFKGGRGMNVSKQDLPVFKAKGWKLKEELEEANMKRLLQALQDKLSKEGGAAGFDDLKKTAKTMGVDLTPDMLKGAPGIKQHRDGDYILEAIVGNPNLSKFMFMFKDTSSVFGGMRQQGKLITAKNKAEATREFKRQLPKAKIISVKEVGDLYGYEETELEEKVEYIEYKFRNSRQAVDAVRFVQSMNTGVPRNLDINSDGENRGIIAFDAGKDDFTKVHKMIVQRFRPQILTVENKEKDLEEAFTRKDFEKLESTNDHTEAAKKLIDMFGTSDEKKEMNDIKARHEKTGYINGKDYSKRQMMVKKYYSRLK